MCGIVGFFGKGDRSDIEEMAGALRHRGPDEIGFYKDAQIPLYFGHTRLTIIDREGGHQPMLSKDGSLIAIFNGQIYNERELRSELESFGYVFQSSHSDTELLIHGYRAWKYDLVHKLNGMWSFAIYDRKEQILLLSRDRFGKKPLFYYFKNGLFAFASEVKAFKKHEFLSLSISTQGIQKYHAYGFFPAACTFYNEVSKLQGGCNLIFDIKKIQYTIKPYWTYKLEPEYDKTEKYWIEQIQHYLAKAVERRLVSDVPLGLFLSGGLDSSAVAFFAVKKLGPYNCNSFSIGFDDSTFDETESAIYVSKLTRTRHYAKKFSSSVLAEIKDEVFSLLDEPLSDSSMLSYYLLCRHSREKITVALGGDAGDELFAGYDTFRAIKIAHFIRRFMPKIFHNGILAILGKLPVSYSYMNLKFKLERLLKFYGNPMSVWQPVWLSPLTPNEICQIINQPVNIEELYSEAIDAWDNCRGGNFIDKSLEFYGKFFLQNQILVKVDRMSMMRSLEVRVPFLDIDLVNCVRRIPSKLKLKGNKTKYIFKKAMEAYLPLDVVWRKKIGFSAPLSKWFLDSNLQFDLSSYWNKSSRDLIINKYNEHLSHKADQRLFLWNCYVLNEIMRRNKDSDPIKIVSKYNHVFYQ